MQEKLKQIADSISEFKPTLKSLHSITAIGKLFMPIRSDELMRKYSFSMSQGDCLWFAIEHLENGEEHSLGECIKWLDAAADAYAQNPIPSVDEQLAEAVRIDIATQLFSFSAAYYYVSRKDIIKESETGSSAELTKALNLATGVLGYLLGRSLEISEESDQAYAALLRHVEDRAPLTEIIQNRRQSLTTFSFINPAELEMDLPEFEAINRDRQSLQRFVEQCCIDGRLDEVSQSQSKILHDAAYAGGLIAAFTFPVGLLVLPPLLAATPFLYLLDIRANRRDQKENGTFYHLINLARVWTNSHFENSSREICPELEAVRSNVEILNSQFTALEQLDPLGAAEKLRRLKDDIYCSRVLTKDNKTAFNARCAAVEANIQQFSNDRRTIRDLHIDIHSFIRYLQDSKRIISSEAQFQNMPATDYYSKLKSRVDALLAMHEEKERLVQEINTELSVIKQKIVAI